MPTLVEAQRLSLGRVRSTSVEISLGLFTSSITVTLQRPTSASPRAWSDDTTIAASIVVEIDGVVQRASGRATGGVRSTSAGEIETYTLQFTPTWGYFGARAGLPRRLAQTATSSARAWCEFALLRGHTAETVLTITSEDAEAPCVPFHSSVAFDTATDVAEASGDGVVSLTHTAGGADRAAFAGQSRISDASDVGTQAVTYDGVAMSALWDNPFSGNGYKEGGRALAGVPTGAKTVTGTLTGHSLLFAQYLGVITLTGVHQTTPTGTPNSAAGNSTAPTVTVASVGADDLVVDNMAVQASGTPSVGADQTIRNSEDASTPARYRQSTQPGTAGGVMSWTVSTGKWSVSGVAFKPAPAATRPSAQVIYPVAVHRAATY